MMFFVFQNQLQQKNAEPEVSVGSGRGRDYDVIWRVK